MATRGTSFPTTTCALTSNLTSSFRSGARAIEVLFLATLGVVVVGCTSFAFPNKGGPGDAPSELTDKGAMVKLPAGTFQMGANQGEPDEYPAHSVELDAFLLDRTEVTNADYQVCVEQNVCRKPAFADDPELGRAKHPVVGVSFSDANGYCAWVGKRLPTEAEWEYAARAPSFSTFPWEGRFKATACNARGDVDGYAKTAPVGSFEEGKSGYGLLDMAGNVAEWTSDWYDATTYKKSEAKNPTGPQLSTGSRSVRGGSFVNNDYLVRTMSRSAQDPATSKNSVGFRCAASVGAEDSDG